MGHQSKPGPVWGQKSFRPLLGVITNSNVRFLWGMGVIARLYFFKCRWLLGQTPHGRIQSGTGVLDPLENHKYKKI